MSTGLASVRPPAPWPAGVERPGRECGRVPPAGEPGPGAGVDADRGQCNGHVQPREGEAGPAAALEYAGQSAKQSYDTKPGTELQPALIIL